MAKYRYWVEAHLQSTSNAQFDANGWVSNHLGALRSSSDTLARVIMKAQFSYASDASGGVPGWWAQASVYAACDWDPTASLTRPTAIGGGVPAERRLLVEKLNPARYSNPEYTPEYQVVWTSPYPITSVKGMRKGNGVDTPRIVYGVRAIDQYAYFNQAAPAEAAGIYRASIVIRAEWLSDLP